ncbi:hypothetical protein NIB75_17750 [Bacteroides uniformis]|nr:hypothetical protein [Bacteroides uniformis]
MHYAGVWKASSDSVTFVREGKVPAHVEQGKVMQVGELKSTLTEIDKPAQLRLTLTTGNYHNYYNLWVYPDRTPESEADIFICQSLDDEARKRLSQGGKILLIPDHKAIEEQSVGGLFTPRLLELCHVQKHFGKRRPRSFAGHPLLADGRETSLVPAVPHRVP